MAHMNGGSRGQREASSLKANIIKEMGRPFYAQLDKDVRKEVDEIDKLRRISEKNNLSVKDLVPA